MLLYMTKNDKKSSETKFQYDLDFQTCDLDKSKILSIKI